MLLRFSAANHLSLRTAQELSLIASALKDENDHVFTSPALPGERTLPVAVIWGPNASGKSNVLHALRFMRGAVLHSHSRGEPGGKIPRSPFKLDEDMKNEVSSFDIDFILEEVRYHFGFTLSNMRVEEEWLYCWENNRRKRLYERMGKEFTFGRSFKGQKETLREITRENSLFVSSAAQNAHSQLTKIRNFFRNIESPSSVRNILKKNSSLDMRVINFLRQIDTGITNYRFVEKDENSLGQEFTEELNELLKRHIGDGIDTESMLFDDDVREIQLAHAGKGKKSYYFDLSEESEGTNRLLPILVSAFKALDTGSVLVVDELDTSLHTQAAVAVIQLFTSPESNVNGAQIIATTHDVNILRHIRRDETWFVEKDKEGATHLFPLTDIRTRASDNIAKGYLEGRYGAIPLAGQGPKVAVE